jgi:hypothetical protein
METLGRLGVRRNVFHLLSLAQHRISGWRLHTNICIRLLLILFELIGGDELDTDEHFDVYNALMEDCELIAREEFNHIIGELKTAVGIIDGAFL